MQVFVPSTSIERIAQILDSRRLMKQRVECLQILNVLQGKLGPKQGWKNHPIMHMWRGYEKALCSYAIIICKEARKRGYQDNLLPKFIELKKKFKNTGLPIWWGKQKIHASHRSNLLRKNSDYYGRFNWKVPNNLKYAWV